MLHQWVTEKIPNGKPPPKRETAARCGSQSGGTDSYQTEVLGEGRAHHSHVLIIHQSLVLALVATPAAARVFLRMVA